MYQLHNGAPDGTRAWIGINESLIVERSSDQRNATTQFQFLVEDNLNRRHIYKVNFTVYCKLLRFFSFLAVTEKLFREIILNFNILFFIFICIFGGSKISGLFLIAFSIKE